ncbi:probable microtubule-binding protein TANGLED [Telopea speciosissima]|uniref:probable microtubule-binding protein TANGLED n=1 Tax=Telopea speciosissima TaxID=54955 RepID=UPI001CC76215|nr:probable microtubule-binding protein TANGLED [Telopea speciosissima]
MVAKTPPKLRRMAAAPLNPNLLRETVKKVDQCMARLQELQYTVSGGTKMISGVNLSPRSTRVYLKTSLRCKQESLRIKNGAARKSPVGKFQGSTTGEWRRMSLPAMLVGETVGEILQASRFAKGIVDAVAANTKKIPSDDPKTPLTQRRIQTPCPENTELRTRRKKEKQVAFQLIRSETNGQSIRRARSRIDFKVSPPSKRGFGKENWHLAHRVSPKNKPWAKKTVLFPNPLFLNSPSSQQHKFCKTRSPVISRARQTPHKFLIKSPNAPSKLQVRVKNTPVCISPTRSINMSKKSPKVSAASKLRGSFSPSRLRGSFSPSRLANRLVSPLKSRVSVQKYGGLRSVLKQRPPTPTRSTDWRI